VHRYFAAFGLACRPGGGAYGFFVNAVPAVTLAAFARPFAVYRAALLTDILGFASRHLNAFCIFG
jgi:hypothetical protein